MVSPVDQIEDRLGDVGRVVADPLDVLGAEQKMGAERDVARILHHVGQKVAEHRILQRVEFDVALPDRARALGIALRVGVEHVLHQLGGDVVHVLQADDRARHARFGADLDRALGDVLGEIADPLEIAGDADRADDLAQVDRHRLAARDGHDRQILDLALQRVEARIGGDDLMGERRVGVGQRVHGVDHHFLRDAAHFGDAALERVELLVVGLDGMFDHGVHSFSRTGR